MSRMRAVKLSKSKAPDMGGAAKTERVMAVLAESRARKAVAPVRKARREGLGLWNGGMFCFLVPSRSINFPQRRQAGKVVAWRACAERISSRSGDRGIRTGPIHGKPRPLRAFGAPSFPSAAMVWQERLEAGIVRNGPPIGGLGTKSIARRRLTFTDQLRSLEGATTLNRIFSHPLGFPTDGTRRQPGATAARP